MNAKPKLLAAAAAGDPRAQLALAHFMLIGRAAAPSADEPARLVAAACAQNFTEALLYRATPAALGVGRSHSLHVGLPVTRGEKWLLSQWVRQRPLPLR